jgi:Transaldolase/Fructose-6-phosphate aldolase
VSTIALYLAAMILMTQRHDDEMATRREQITLELAILSEQKSSKITALLEEFRRNDRNYGGHRDEVRRLWQSQLMRRSYSMRSELPRSRRTAIRRIHCNDGQIFSVERYRAVLEASLQGLEQRPANDQPLERLESVASFFVSRIDVEVDCRLDAMLQGGNTDAPRLRGKAATANAQLAYEAYEETRASPRSHSLVAKGGKCSACSGLRPASPKQDSRSSPKDSRTISRGGHLQGLVSLNRVLLRA